MGPAATAGCRAHGCGSAEAPADMPPAVWEKVKRHPCYSVEAHHFFARMHVAVAPRCNIQCNYCNRKYDCANESRPGVVSERMTPEQAERKVLAVAARMPQLSVVGIAGPGDALANAAATFETCDRIAQRLPDVALCLSTNGLALSEHVAAIKARNISHVTITLNAIDPEIAARIYAWIVIDRKRHTGVDAARLLIERQLDGLKRAVAAGLLVKVNSVMIPGINDEHLREVNAEVRRQGAFLHNIMPLISDPRHGTRFGLDGQRGPTAAELKVLQDGLAGGARLMKHCRQCRADAVGLLGNDCGQEFNLAKIEPAAVTDDPGTRQAYRAFVDEEQVQRNEASAQAARTLRTTTGAAPMLVAVCTKGGGRINQHFGHAREFQIFEVDRTGVRLVGHRRAQHYCQGGDGDDDVLERTIEALAGVSAVLCARIGSCPKDQLAAAGIRAVDDFAFEYIETAVAALFRAEAARDIAPARTA
ncbi:MAG: nitrogenase cofactor biosynthesis protein NifB [Defluviicoccus sp.]